MNASDLDLNALRARLLASAVPELSLAARKRILRPYVENARGMRLAHKEAREIWLELREAEAREAADLLGLNLREVSL